MMIVARAVATIGFDLWGQLVSPAIGRADLSPHGLARSLPGRVGLPNGGVAGVFVHCYPAGPQG